MNLPFCFFNSKNSCKKKNWEIQLQLNTISHRIYPNEFYENKIIRINQ